MTGSCGIVACVPPSGSIFPVGTTTDICTATTQGSATTTCSFPITVNDVAGAGHHGSDGQPGPPVAAQPQMDDVTVSYSTADNCTLPSSITCALSVASNEPVNGTGDGDTSPDWQVVNPTT